MDFWGGGMRCVRCRATPSTSFQLLSPRLISDMTKNRTDSVQ